MIGYGMSALPEEKNNPVSRREIAIEQLTDAHRSLWYAWAILDEQPDEYNRAWELVKSTYDLMNDLMWQQPPIQSAERGDPVLPDYDSPSHTQAPLASPQPEV